MIVTKKDIRQGLERLGVSSGDYIIAHSSLTSFGRVDGGALTVVDALLEAVGAGLLLMPTYARVNDSHGDVMPFVDDTGLIWTGAIPKAFATHPKTIRGRHPLYSLTLAGADARQLAEENEEQMFPYGRNQLFRVLLRQHGYILLIGVDDRSNSSIHMIEEIVDPNYLQEKKSQSHMTVDDFFDMPLPARRESLVHHSAGPSRDFTRVSKLLEQAKATQETRVGNALLTLEPALKVSELVQAALRNDPDFLIRRKQ